MEFIPIDVIRSEGVKFTEVKTRVYADPVTNKDRLMTPRLFRDAETLVNHFKRLNESKQQLFLYEATAEEKNDALKSYKSAGSCVAVFGTSAAQGA